MWKLIRSSYLLLLALFLVACGGGGSEEQSSSASPPQEQEEETSAPSLLNIPLTDVRTGATFTLTEYTGQTVFIEPMATW